MEFSFEHEKVHTALTDEEVKILARLAHKFVREHEPITVKMKIGDFDTSMQSPYHPIALEKERLKIQPNVGKRFDAHGIAKGSMTEQLQSLNVLLSKGIDPDRPFHTMELRVEDDGFASGLGASHPYTDGGFIVTGKPDQLIREGGIAAVIVNEHFYSAIQMLKAKFPYIEFMRADEAPDRLAQMVQSNGA